MKRSAGSPCPMCSGTDRFVLIPKPRNGGSPFYWCRQCRHLESVDGETIDGIPGLSRRELTAEEQELAHVAYGVAAAWCAEQLWTPGGAVALAYLHNRGLTDDTIREVRLGMHPRVTGSSGLGDALYHLDPSAYKGARLGGLLAQQGRALSILHDVITLPYLQGDTYGLLRFRKLNPGDGPKYLSPAGVGLYAGGKPHFFLHDVLDESSATILTEGEIKAALGYQAWREGTLSVPSVGTPGIAYLPEPLIDALCGKTVFLCYDSEERKDHFMLSPGERFTIRNGEILSGLKIKHSIDRVEQKLSKRGSLGADERERLLTQAEQLHEEYRRAIDRRISVRVIRLPRASGVTKVDLDSFILKSGPAALQSLVNTAPPFEQWYAQHGLNEHRYDQGGMWRGNNLLANYQARIIEDVTQSDGVEETGFHRIALRSPSGITLTTNIPSDVWAEPKTAMQRLRAALHEGTADDKDLDTFRAIKSLSRQGGDPPKRNVYTATGWQHINGHWHYLANDGAITSTGPTQATRAELPSSVLGNHYALCGSGNVCNGVEALLNLLRGKVCPQPLALVLVAHAVLAVLHRFISNGNRPLVWLYGPSGSLKSSLVRVFLSLFGPAFTAECDDGGPLAKWESTYNALELLAFTCRDVLFCPDDFKEVTGGRDTVARFLHSYSEGSSRGRMTRDRRHDRTYPARGIAVVTAEDRPIGDSGQLGRVLLFGLKDGDVNDKALQSVQRAGVNGDLTACWRTFIQVVAHLLDEKGETYIRARFQDILRADDERLPGHRRSEGALRQNRAAWLMVRNWLVQANYISLDEAEQLDAAHLQSRRLLAQEQQAAQTEESPEHIFLSIVGEELRTGRSTLAPDPAVEKLGRGLNDQGEGNPDRLIGFHYKGDVALYKETAFALVQRIRTAQRQPLQYSAAAIVQRLISGGHVVRYNKGRTDYQIREGPSRLRVWWLKSESLGLCSQGQNTDPEQGNDVPEVVTGDENNVTNTAAHVVTPMAAQKGQEFDVSPQSPLSPITFVNNDEMTPPTQFASAPANPKNDELGGDFGDGGDNVEFAHQEAAGVSPQLGDTASTSVYTQVTHLHGTASLSRASDAAMRPVSSGQVEHAEHLLKTYGSPQALSYIRATGGLERYPQELRLSLMEAQS